MKNIVYYFAIISVVMLLACNSKGGAENKEKETKGVKTETYSLIVENSTVSWVRSVDYKHLKQRVKLFGAWVDTEMDNVQLETNGVLKINSGSLVLTDDVPTSADIEIDLTLTRFYSDIEESFFESETYDPAKLIINKFEADSVTKGQYNVTANLTMNGKTAEITFPATLTTKDSDIIFSGTYLMQVSDWPLLKQPKPENINHDEISFGFDFVFGYVKVENDTVVVE